MFEDITNNYSSEKGHAIIVNYCNGSYQNFGISLLALFVS